MKHCSTCDGDGWVQFSCCGDDMKMYLPDCDLCPSCLEHQGEPEKEKCEDCDGIGGYEETTADEFNKEKE